MIVLDLSSEVKPTYNSLESYFGQAFIWCMLHDYGGVVDWYGMVDSINKVPTLAGKLRATPGIFPL